MDYEPREKRVPLWQAVLILILVAIVVIVIVALFFPTIGPVTSCCLNDL